MKATIFIIGDFSAGYHLKALFSEQNQTQEIKTGWVLTFADVKTAKADLKKVYQHIKHWEYGIVQFSKNVLTYEGTKVILHK